MDTPLLPAQPSVKDHELLAMEEAPDTASRDQPDEAGKADSIADLMSSDDEGPSADDPTASGQAPAAPAAGAAQQRGSGNSLPRIAATAQSERVASSAEASTSSPRAQAADQGLPPIKSPSGSQANGSSPKGRGAGSTMHHGPTRTYAYYRRPAPPPPKEKPKPRARHDTAHVDPEYLQTAAYRKVKGVGMMYDWKAQHDVNEQLAKQRKQQAKMVEVLDAARVQLQHREQNNEAFQKWLADKEQEKEAEWYNRQKSAYVATVYRKLTHADSGEHQQRETAWVSNFGARAGGAAASRTGRGPARQLSAALGVGAAAAQRQGQVAEKARA